MAVFNWVWIIGLVFLFKPFFQNQIGNEDGSMDIVQFRTTPTPGFSPGLEGLAVINPTPVPTLIPTVTPDPTPDQTQDQGLWSEVIYVYKLSFYDPNIGIYFPDIAKVNCSIWDDQLNKCIAVMANGKTFEDYYGLGVACPPGFELGSLINVLYPEQLQGIWECVDRGGAIEGEWLDFLLKYPDQIWTGYDLNNFAWSSPVVFKRQNNK